MLAALAAAATLLVSACGGSGDSGAAAPQGASGSASTVAVDGVNGVGDVLVDARGAALYAADQESNGTIACTGSCTTIWDPLTVPGARAPTADSDVMGMLGVVKRPDGARQVTLDGRPLYRFAEDPETGSVTGNGLADSFDGKSFEWHVATPDGVSTSSSNSSSGSSGY